MKDDDFEWDEAKAAANFAKHGVTFEMAQEAFDDMFAIEAEDRRSDYGEDRDPSRHGRRQAVIHCLYAKRRQNSNYFSPRGRAL
jgi:uncharacterized DUF497 family protein